MIAQSPPSPISGQVQSRCQALGLDQLAARVARPAGPAPAWLDVEAPFTGEMIGRVPACDEADVAWAVRQARAAQPSWAARPLRERQAIFRRYHDLVLQHREELLDLIQLESGKARQHALEEVFDLALTSRYYAYHAGRFLASRPRRGLLPGLNQVHEHRHPVGVVGIISPWNYPLTLAISDAVPALIAGNSIVLKPSELTPFTALAAARLLQEAGLPDGFLQVVTGAGHRAGPALVDRVDFVMFTGSTATGRQVAQQAAARLIPYSLELGGKNPAIVLDDADLDGAVEGISRGAFTSTGQLCISFERLYVQQGIYDRFVGRLVERVQAIRLGAGFDYEAEVGSLISRRQLETVQGHVQDALAKGASLLAGGRSRPELGPYFYEPTLLAGVADGMVVCREETFGPVVAVYRFDTVAEAIRLANDSAYGLNASLWSRNLVQARRLARQLQSGTVNLNESYAATWAAMDAPMGGMKASGIGRRHGREGILKYTESQVVGSQHLLPMAPVKFLPAARFARVMTVLLLLLRRIPGLR